MTKEKLKVSKEKKENNQLELTVETLPEVATKAYTIAYRDIANEMNIPGFRKGKAPRNVVEKSVGVGYITQKAFEKIFYSVFIEATLQEKLDVVDVVQVLSYELEPEKPLKFVVLIELKPEVKLGDYKGRKVKAKKPVYDQEAFVKSTLDKIATNFVNFEPVTDRPVKEGDSVTLDFEGKFEDGAEVPGGKAENYEAILEKGAFLPEFVDKLQGTKVGESKDVEVTFPKDAAKDFAEKKAIFTVKINAIGEKVLPAVDDELAQKVGVESLEKLEDRIVNEMNQMQENTSKNDFEMKLVDAIIEDSKMDLSEIMINKEIDFLLKDMKAGIEKAGQSWEEFKSDEKNKEIMKNARESAEKRLKIDFTIGAIIKAEDISATNEEVNKALVDKIAEMGPNYKHLENDFRFKASVEQGVLRNKAIDFLCENNEADWEEEKQEIGAK